MTKQQAVNVIANIIDSKGYEESDGDLWLGPRLQQLLDHIELGASNE